MNSWAPHSRDQHERSLARVGVLAIPRPCAAASFAACAPVVLKRPATARASVEAT